MGQPPGACLQENLENTCPPEDQGMCCERGRQHHRVAQWQLLSGPGLLGRCCYRTVLLILRAGRVLK